MASIYGPHTLGKRAALWNRLRNSFSHTNILLCGDWNMVDLPEDSSRDEHVLNGAKETAFSQFRVKHNLTDL